MRSFQLSRMVSARSRRPRIGSSTERWEDRSRVSSRWSPSSAIWRQRPSSWRRGSSAWRCGALWHGGGRGDEPAGLAVHGQGLRTATGRAPLGRLTGDHRSLLQALGAAALRRPPHQRVLRLVAHASARPGGASTCRPPAGLEGPDGTTTMGQVDLMWGSDLNSVMTGEGQAALSVAVDHHRESR